MKFLHLGDLHIGKRVNEFPMIDDQKYIMSQIINSCESEKFDGIFIAGDIYDKSIPSIEAIELFESFIEKISNMEIPIYIVSGNHDSVERLSVFANLIKQNKIFISKPYSGTINPIIQNNVAIWLLPFVRPCDVRKYFSDVEIGNYDDAVKKVIQSLNLDMSKVNILVAHQFVIANGLKPQVSDSESCSLGTLDSVDFKVFNNFDYVALGHIHKPQNMGRKEVRYCGSPLKYSFSEVNQKKSMTVVNVSSEKKIKIDTIPFKPKTDMKEIKGNLEELLTFPKDESYMHITLTDVSVIDAKSKLEGVFPNIMKLDFEEYNQCASSCGGLKALKSKSLEEHFEDFFAKQTKNVLNDDEKCVVSDFLKQNDGELI